MKRRTITKEEKITVVQELQSGKNIVQVCREHEIKPNMAYRWTREYEENPTHAFAGHGKACTLEARNAELERLVGRLCLENDFLKKVQQALQQRLAETKNGR